MGETVANGWAIDRWYLHFNGWWVPPALSLYTLGVVKLIELIWGWVR